MGDVGCRRRRAAASRPAGVGRPVGRRCARPGWRSRWRLVPLVLIVVVVVIAVAQVLRPSGNQVHKEAAGTAALLGKCLAQHGTAEGHPKYSSKPVPCDSPVRRRAGGEGHPEHARQPPLPGGDHRGRVALSGVSISAHPVRGSRSNRAASGPARPGRLC